MDKLTVELKNGQKFEIEEFELKDANLRKLRIDYDGEEGEGIWGYFSDEGVKLYDGDHRSGEYEQIVFLANPPVAFYPHNFWGVALPIKFLGSQRPYCNLADLTGAPAFHSTAPLALAAKTEDAKEEA